MYLHADMRMTEKVLSHTEPLGIKPARFRPDQLLAWPFWKAYDYADSGGHASPSQPLTPLSIRHNQEVGIFLVHIHADIFSHKRVFLSGGFEASTQTLLHKGRPFILRRVTGKVRTGTHLIS
jgi:hypothetical protein